MSRSFESAERLQQIVGERMKQVFLWMVIGLFITIATAYYTLTNPSLFNIVARYSFPIIIGQLILVFTLSFKVYKMDVSTSRMMFLLYSFTNGLLLSGIAIVYTGSSILMVFGGTLTIFLIMAAYGYITNEDLSKYGSLLRGGLITIIILTVVNAFLIKAPMMYMMISYLGVLLFIGLIGYDVNRIKNSIVRVAMYEDEGVLDKISVIGALSLYLDFINLFLYLLRIFGRRR